jgi:Peptidase family C25
VIFAGDASYDPRDYLGYGNRDFVPTKLVDATFNETSSDEWFTDFDNDGVGEIPVGRLPVSSVAQANIVISKIVNFSPANVPQSALLVADTQGTYYYNFEQANTEVQALLPAGMTVQRVDRRLQPSDAVASANIIANMNSGQALVNYSGHGNVDTWTDASIFTTDNAEVLNNGVKLPLVVVMDCLNGYFQEPSPTFSGLAEAFLQAPNGGAVASFASSGLTIPDGQHVMNLQLYTLLYGSQPIALGDAIKISKAATSDIDVRRTWIFFGDPSMRIR